MNTLQDLLDTARSKYPYFELQIRRYKALGGDYWHVCVREQQVDGTAGLRIHGYMDKDLSVAISKVIGGMYEVGSVQEGNGPADIGGLGKLPDVGQTT